MAIQEKRLFVGGLFHGVTQQQVRERFDKFGLVNSVNVRVKNDETGQPVKTFAYVDIAASEKSLKQCMQVYNKSKWKGSELQLQLAKESFLDRLKKEQTESKDEIEASVEEPIVDIEEPSIAVTMVPKKAVPGTLVGEEKTWVVGKYGRVLPIVNIRRKDKKKVILFDPSKCLHQVKKLDTSTKNVEAEKPIDNLTWQLDIGNIKKMKLRTGQVAWKKPVKETKTKMSATEPVTEPSPKKPKVLVDLNQFEIVKSHSTFDVVHRQSDDESYNSADTEEMITQMKSNSWKKSGKNGSHMEVMCKSTSNSTSVDLKSKANLSVFNRADISAISVISTPVNGSVEKLQRLSVCGRLNPLKSLKHAAMKTSTPKDVIAKRVYDSDSERDSSLERFPPKKKQKSKPPKDVKVNDGNSSPDTDDIISDSRRKVRPPRKAGVTASSETSLYVTADDDLRPLPGRSELCEDDDDDIFDLIESGRIDQLYKSAESSRNLGAKSKTFKEINSQLGDEHTSKPSDATLEISVNESMECEADLSSSKKFKPKKNQLNKTVTEPVATTVVTPAKGKKTEKAASAQEMQTESTTVASSLVTPAKSKKVKKAASAQEMQTESTSVVTSKVKPVDAKKTEKAEFAQKFDKRKLSNEQRMTSVNERLKEARSQRFLIKKALSDVDKTSSAKIIFDSSDEEDLRVSATARETSVSENAETTGDSSDESSTSDDEMPKPDDKTKRKKGVLFDSDDGSGESEAGDQRMFELRPEFEGKAGSELMKLQARFRNDQRFKLDKRFLESDSDEDDQDEAIDDAPDLAEGDDERARSLAILKEVVGEKAIQHINQRSKKKATFKDVATLHYDPSREDHKHFELEKPSATEEGEEGDGEKTSKKKKKKKKKKKEDAKSSKPSVEPVEKVPGKFFEVSGSLKDLLKPAEKKQFSLLSMFGGSEPDHIDKNQKLNNEAVAEKLPVGHMQWQPQFGSDDSDDETEGASFSVREDAKAVEPVKSQAKAGEPKTFFFVDNDCRIAEGIKSFCRPEDWEAVREKWLERRPDLVEDYRMKRKRAIRKAQSQREKFGKTQRGGRR